MLSPADRFSYALRQSARIAWYMGHYFASQRFRARPADETEEHRPRRQGGLSRETILAAMGRLFARDLANVERGFYPVPRDRDGDLRGLIESSRRYFADLPVAAERKQSRRADEVHRFDCREVATVLQSITQCQWPPELTVKIGWRINRVCRKSRRHIP